MSGNPQEPQRTPSDVDVHRLLDPQVDDSRISLGTIFAALAHRYRIQREVARGGSAIVFLATDIRNDQQVALKVLRPELSQSAAEERFRREIRIERDLTHPNILQILDVGEAAGLLYFTMPFVAGETLRTRIRRERQLRLKDVMAITEVIAETLDFAHAKGFIHRDIKPANILLDGNSVFLADFGIARAMTVALGDRITESRVSVGTPEYMSPEQAAAQKDLDARSDVYALGCVIYEMLAGEPPFTGPNVQAVFARHIQEPPRSLRVIRPSIPIGLERAVHKALSKTPADRFDSAGQLFEAMRTAVAARPSVFDQLPVRRPAVISGLALVVALGAGVVWMTSAGRAPPLDDDRVVVFPLNEVGGVSPGTGEAVATFIGYGLERTRPLKWLDGWELLRRNQRDGLTRVQPREALRLSTIARAGYFIDGSIMQGSDSVTVVLRLYSVAGDSVVRRAGQSAARANASLPQLGLAAVRDLLPDLVAPGGVLDLSALSQRRPSAVANFLQGEREYRRMQFFAALPHYERALEEDSLFVLAALRGGHAASWLSENDVAQRLTAVALRDVGGLTPGQAMVARGLASYLDGDADSAIAHLHLALRMDPTVHAAWTVLAEVYLRLLPSAWNFDSLARHALERARAVDPGFAPALLLLEEIAIRDGDVARASTFGAELRRAGADTTHAVARELMMTCLRSGSEKVGWGTFTSDQHLAVLTAGKVLGGAAAQPQCALGAYRALLADTAVPPHTRWGALLGAVPLLVATRRVGEVDALMRLPGIPEFSMRSTYLASAAVSRIFSQEAESFADSASGSYERYGASLLWHLSNYEAVKGRTARLGHIARVLSWKADSSGTPRDSRLARSAAARMALLSGDTTRAIELLRSIKADRGRQWIGWDPAESNGPERLLLAQLLYGKGEHETARQTATLLDSTEPVSFPLYIRQSLELRRDASSAMGRSRLAAGYQRRLDRMRAH